MAERPDAVDDARRGFEEAVEAFRRAGVAAVDAARDPRVDVMSLSEARTKATFALAAASLAFKAALRAARPDPEPD